MEDFYSDRREVRVDWLALNILVVGISNRLFVPSFSHRPIILCETPLLFLRRLLRLIEYTSMKQEWNGCACLARYEG